MTDVDEDSNDDEADGNDDYVVKAMMTMMRAMMMTWGPSNVSKQQSAGSQVRDLSTKCALAVATLRHHHHKDIMAFFFLFTHI